MRGVAPSERRFEKTMTSARRVRPADLLTLLSFDGSVHPNDAHTWERAGRAPKRPNVPAAAAEQLTAFFNGRHTWISTRRGKVLGLLSARPLGSRLAWEIDYLVVAGDDALAILGALVERLTAAATQSGVLRVFLRVAANSTIVDRLHAVGFMPVAGEALFEFRGESPTTPLDRSLNVRPRRRVDGFPLFRLYNGVTPTEVRRVEAATYNEWIAAQERRGKGRGVLDAVVERNGDLVAWLRAMSDCAGGRIDLLVHPDLGAPTAGLLAHTVGALPARRPIFCLVAEYTGSLTGLLEEGGFEHRGDYIRLVKRFAVPVQQLSPVRLPAHQPLIAG